MSLQLQVWSDEKSWRVTPTKVEIRVGRAPDNDIVLQDRMVSGHHLLLRTVVGGYQVVDLNSTNGTRLNGTRLPPQQPQRFGPGDVLVLGGSRITLAREAVDRAVSAGPGPATQVAGRTPNQSAPRRQVPPQRVPQPEPSRSKTVYGVLQVKLAQGDLGEYPLLKPDTTMGRADDNDVILDGRMVSRHHLRVLVDARGQVAVMDLGSLNGTRLNGQPLAPRRPEPLRPGDTVQLHEFSLGVRPVTPQAPAPPGLAAQVRVASTPPVTFTPVAVAEAGAAVSALAPGVTRRLSVDAQDSITIGRAPDNTVTLDHPQVSRYHAMIERLGTRRRIKDLKSANGVFVNGQRIDGEAWLNDGDEIYIGPLKFRLAAGQVQQLADEGVRLDVMRINKWVTKDLNLLKDISLSIQPLEFVALVGLSGAGKSTLMDAINGFRPATHGTVLANGTNLYENFDLFRNDMGYVPQKDIVHTELTVYKALDYAAQLRMPADTTSEERHQRIMETMTDLDLEERKDLPIHKLSGGQLKRVSIGVELLTKPRLFFLDEPTSGLDPGTEYNMMRLLRKLADQGRTIMLITHATKNVMMCDKVIILVRGGRVAFYGPPEEALLYFDQYRTDYERRIKDIEFDDIYTILEDDQRGSPEDWDERYRGSSAYAQYVLGRLQDVRDAPQPVERAASRQKAVKRVSALRQFFILSKRNLNIMTQDKASLALMLALSPVIGLADFMWGRQLFSPVLGDAFNIVTMLFMMGLISILVGAMASVREIVKEIDIYKRERAVALKIGPYIFSKLWIGIVLAIYQAVVFIITKALFVGFSPPLLSLGTWFAVFITLFIGSLSGYLMGLTISAGSPNQMVALLMVILVLVPQFLFAGALMPLDLIPGGRVISAFATTRWAFGAFVRLAGVGEQLAGDACWPADRTLEGADRGWNEWLQASNDEKVAFCSCMGPNAFTRCDDFPGILNPEFFGFDKPEGRVFEGTTYGGTKALVDGIKNTIWGSTTWQAIAESPTAPDMPSPESCFDSADQVVAAETCEVPPCPAPRGPEEIPYDPNVACSQDPQTAIRQCETFRQSLVGYRDGLAECEAGVEELRTGLQDACDGLNECTTSATASGNEMETCMDDWQADMEVWEDDMEVYQDAQEDRQRAISGAEGMLKNYWEKFNFIYGTGVVATWFYMGLIDLVLVVAILVFQKRKDTV
ncbi:MAG: FHA domain-containing protein [Anaerolineae bacterium]